MNSGHQTTDLGTTVGTIRSQQIQLKDAIFLIFRRPRNIPKDGERTLSLEKRNTKAALAIVAEREYVMRPPNSDQNGPQDDTGNGANPKPARARRSYPKKAPPFTWIVWPVM